MPTPEKYPIKKTDNLGRVVYIDWNGVERICNKYWDDTNIVKVKYRYFGNDVTLDAYDRKGINIISFSSGTIEIYLERFRIYADGELDFTIEKSTLKKWKNFLNERQKNKKTKTS